MNVWLCMFECFFFLECFNLLRTCLGHLDMGVKLHDLAIRIGLISLSLYIYV